MDRAQSASDKILSEAMRIAGNGGSRADVLALAAASFFAGAPLPVATLQAELARDKGVFFQMLFTVVDSGSSDGIEKCCAYILLCCIGMLKMINVSEEDPIFAATEALKAITAHNSGIAISVTSRDVSVKLSTAELHSQIFSLRAGNYLQAGDFENANLDLEEALKLDPKNGEARRYMVVLNYQMDKHTESLKHATFMKDHLPVSEKHVDPYLIAAVILLRHAGIPDINAKANWIDPALAIAKSFNEKPTDIYLKLALKEYAAVVKSKKNDIRNTFVEDILDKMQEPLLLSGGTKEPAGKKAVSDRGRPLLVKPGVVPAHHIIAKEDGDQTVLSIAKGDALRERWAEGMDFNPSSLRGVHLICFCGRDLNDPSTRAELDSATKDELEKRVSQMNLSPLILAVEGCRQSVRLAGSPVATGKHLLLVNYLVNTRKVNVEGRDVIGNTALFHSLALRGNDTMLEMARLLVNAGANINMQNRYGCTPMHEAVMRRDQKVVRFMMELGADYNIADYEGMTPLELAKLLPTISKVIADAEVARQRAAAGTNATESDEVWRKCYCCPNKGKACACMAIRYCGKECQKADYPRHKSECEAIRNGDMHLDVNLRSADMSITPLTDVKEPSKDKKLHAKRTVKIQMLPTYGIEMLVYDKTRSFQKTITASEPGYKRLFNLIGSRGVLGRKAYFTAYISPESQAKGVDSMRLKLEVLTPEDW